MMPLEGLRALDLSRVLAGPFCCALLAEVGAEVIKIELPGAGDDARRFAPFKGGESSYFMLINRGKKSITLNLKSAKGVEVLRGLAALSDVVVENFRPGVAERLGVDYPALRQANPGLVYASISGFGQEGPLAHRPAYDTIAQAMSGLMSVTGAADGPPTRVGESLGDLVAGLYAAWAIVAALLARERSGQGQHLDVAMLDSLFSLLVTPLSKHLATGENPTRVGSRHPISTPFDSYRAADGHVIIAVANDALFARLAEAMGQPGLARDPRFASDEERTRHEPELRAIIEAWTGGLGVDEAVATLEAAAVPASPIWTIEQVVRSAHIGFREMLTTVHHPAAGEVTLLRQPVRFSGAAQADVRPPPRLGEHTAAVLGDLLGLDQSVIAGLRRDGVI